MPRPKRNYSDARKAEVLALLDANEGNVSKTARAVGIPGRTIIEWRNGRLAEGVEEIREEKRAELADRLQEIAHTLVDAIPEKVATANLQQCTLSLAIAVDKMQLLRGAATSRTAMVDETRTPLEQLDDLILEIRGLGGDRREETPPIAEPREVLERR